MNTFRVSLFLVVVVALTCLGDGRRVSQGECIGASPPQMPLLHAWVDALASGKTPQHAEDLQALTTRPLPDIDFRKSHLDSLHARLCDRGRSFVATLEYSGVAASDMGTCELFYGMGADVLSQHRASADSSWILLDSPLEATALRVRLRSGDPPMVRATEAVHIKRRREEILVADSPIRPGTLPTVPSLAFDPQRLEYLAYDVTSDKRYGWLPIKEQTDESKLDLGIGKVGDGLVVGGTHQLVRETPDASLELVWSMLREGAKTWTLYRQPTPYTYLRSLFPQPLQGLKLIEDDGPDYVRVAPDGSLLFRFRCVEHNGLDQLMCVGIARQRLSQPPEILIWGIYHSLNVEPISHTPASNNEALQASQALTNMWYPVEGGAIQSTYSVPASWPADFLFDVDGENRAVIYIVGGRLWKLNIPDRQK